MNINVENLSYTSDEQNLEVMFKKYGRVDTVQIVKDYYKGTAKGFVRMINPTDAERAIKALNGKNVNGEPWVVTLAR